jgi:hypothetical protein
MKSKSNPFVPSIAIVVSLIAINTAQLTSAATGTWTGASDGITWDTTANNWSGVSGTPWDFINGPSNTATFNTASLATVISGPVHTNWITFSTTGAVSASTINLVGTTPGINVATGQTGTISSILAGSAGLIKSDAGLLTLSNRPSVADGLSWRIPRPAIRITPPLPSWNSISQLATSSSNLAPSMAPANSSSRAETS